MMRSDCEKSQKPPIKKAEFNHFDGKKNSRLIKSVANLDIKKIKDRDDMELKGIR